MAKALVDSNDLIKACENYIQKREARIASDIEAAIQYTMEKYKQMGFIRRHWTYGSLNLSTHENASAFVHSPRSGGLFYSWAGEIELQGAGRAEQAKKFMQLGKVSDKVYLSEDDVWIMSYL